MQNCVAYASIRQPGDGMSTKSDDLAAKKPAAKDPAPQDLAAKSKVLTFQELSGIVMRPTGLEDGTQNTLSLAKIPLVKSGELTLKSSFVPPGPDGAKARPLFDATRLDRIRQRYLVILEWETDEGEYGSGTAVEFETADGTFWLFQDSHSHLVIKITPTTPPRFGVFSKDRIDLDVQLQVQDRFTGASWVYGHD